MESDRDMTESRISGTSLALLTWMQLALFGCVENNADKTETQENSEWLIRQATPESDFKPAGIESVIDGLVTVLNGTEQQLGTKAVFMPKSMGGYFEDSILGANRAFAELGLLGTIAAPLSSDQDATATPSNQAQMQIDLFDEQLQEGVLLYGIAPNSADVVSRMNSAVDAGGVVVTFDSDKSESLRQFYVGTNNAEAGRIAGATVDDLIQTGTVGTVIILGYDDEGWEDGYNRTHEARKVLEGEGHTVVVLHTDWSDDEANVVAIKDALINADPPAAACLGVFNNSYACGDAVVSAGLQASVKIAAFDAEAQTLEYMQQGVIQATHVQRVYYMGYLVPYILYAVHTVGVDKTRELLAPLMEDAARIDTGLDVIWADRLGAYDAFMDELNAM